MARALALLGEQEAAELIEKEGKVEMTCEFCNEVLSFGRAELDAAFAKIKVTPESEVVKSCKERTGRPRRESARHGTGWGRFFAGMLVGVQSAGPRCRRRILNLLLLRNRRTPLLE